MLHTRLQILPFPHINYQLKTSRPADRAFVKLLKVTLLVICGVLVASIYLHEETTSASVSQFRVET
nr:hypothetical protein Iba_chr13dCG10840 [Ipomoea batatas]